MLKNFTKNNGQQRKIRSLFNKDTDKIKDVKSMNLYAVIEIKIKIDGRGESDCEENERSGKNRLFQRQFHITLYDRNIARAGQSNTISIRVVQDQTSCENWQ